MGEMGPFIWCGVGHEGGFEMAMEPLDQTVLPGGGRLWSSVSDAKKSCQASEKGRLKLAPAIGHDFDGNSKAADPGGRKCGGDSLGSDVCDGTSLRPAREPVDNGLEVPVALR